MKLLISIYLLLFFCSCELQAQRTTEVSESTSLNESEQGFDSLFYQERFSKKAELLKEYLKKNAKYNQRFAILIDMKKPSQYNRFYVVNMDSLSIVSAGLVAHGSGSETGFEDSLQFSNTPNSYMTSLGKYKIGAAYIGNFGKSYKLHGLESSNSKAFERFVVLHRYSCVPDDEQISPICNSLGCPMLSENYFETLEALLQKQSNKNIILEIFY
ncbi:MAG: murein L,D-transpeptidase catalytic domain family protein [Bacteroidota bacterium]